MNEFLTRFLYALWYLGNLALCVNLALRNLKQDRHRFVAMEISLGAFWFLMMARYILYCF